MESLTGILMRLNLCISSVCSPERGVGGDTGRKTGGYREKRVEVKEGSYVERREKKE